jgi:hypothetical protein
MKMKNLHNLSLACAISLSVALGGCATTPGTISTTTSNISAVIAAVQQAAVASCAFLPTAATVTNIIGAAAGVGAATTLATDIASQICSAVSAVKSGKRGAAAPTVNGVAVHGRFVG